MPRPTPSANRYRYRERRGIGETHFIFGNIGRYVGGSGGKGSVSMEKDRGTSEVVILRVVGYERLERDERAIEIYIWHDLCIKSHGDWRLNDTHRTQRSEMGENLEDGMRITVFVYRGERRGNRGIRRGEENEECGGRRLFEEGGVMATVYGEDMHVVLPSDVAKLLPKNRLLSESEWRAIGVQQSIECAVLFNTCWGEFDLMTVVGYDVNGIECAVLFNTCWGEFDLMTVVGYDVNGTANFPVVVDLFEGRKYCFHIKMKAIYAVKGFINLLRVTELKAVVRA
ncbi:cyclin-dependent kinases regulatory subunit 1 [Tanacetum coccineum]